MARQGSAPGRARPELSHAERLPTGTVKDWVAQKKLQRKTDDGKIARLRALREAAQPAEPVGKPSGKP
jgi:hypothetical protein